MRSAKSPLQVLIERLVTEKASLSRGDMVFAFECMFNGSESDISYWFVSYCFGHEG